MIEKKVENFKRNIRKESETCFKVEYNFKKIHIRIGSHTYKKFGIASLSFSF